MHQRFIFIYMDARAKYTLRSKVICFTLTFQICYIDLVLSECFKKRAKTIFKEVLQNLITEDFKLIVLLKTNYSWIFHRGKGIGNKR